jgi:hypothetical protein
MAGPHSTRNKDLIELAKVWRAQTGSLSGRSKELEKLDKALKDFERLGNLGAVEEAFDGWKAKYKATGERWEDSHRNKNRFMPFQRLNAILSASGDSDTAFGNTPDFMHANHVNARQGVLYLFGHMEVETSVAAIILEGGLNLLGGALSYAGADIGAGGGLGIEAASTAGTNIGTARVLLEDVAKIAMDTRGEPTYGPANKPSSAVIEKFRAIKKTLSDWFLQFVNNLKVELMDKFGIVDMAIGSVHNLISVLVSALASKAAPIVGGAMQIVTGLTQTIDRGMTNFKAWKAGKGVVLAEGHPAAVVSAITLAMKASLFEGLWTTLKGATSIGLSAMAGISAIVDMIIAGVEMIVKVMWRLIECHKLKAFCAEAASHWRQNTGLDFAAKPFAFNSWYRKSSLFMPAIPILTLNSGLCGDKMVWLQMFNDKASGIVPIGQDQFDQGVAYIDGHLKPWGAKYLKDCAYGFSSESDQVVAAIERSKTYSSPDVENKAWTIFKTAVRAESAKRTPPSIRR